MSVPFQAIECYMSSIIPMNGKFPKCDPVTLAFESMHSVLGHSIMQYMQACQA